MIVETSNHGPLILASTYWGGEADRAGVMHLSVNAGAFRLLLPGGWEKILDDMRTGKEVVVSRGPWSRGPGRGADSVELLFEDGTSEPFSIHLSAGQCDRLPPDSDAGREFVFTAWTAPRRGAPHRAMDRQCWYRRVTEIPWLKPRSATDA